MLLRRTVVIGAIALGVLWAGIAVGEFVTGDDIGIAYVALVGMAITWGLAFVVRRYQARLESLADTDPLTGLANHRGFHNLLDQALAEAEQAGTEVAVVIADLDDFKAVNDTHGHPHGDRVLISVAERLNTCTRSGDVIGRIGGEEFAFVVEGGAERAADLANRVRAAVGFQPVLGHALTCSAGTAVFPADAADGASLCALADAAMYSAKRAGKDRVRRFDPELMRHDWTARQRAEIEEILRRPDGIEAAFQPVISLATGRLMGYEALARFPGLPGRPVPGVFAQANGSGLGPELEAAAIRAALTPLGRPPGTHLALNLSPSALGSSQVRESLPENLEDLVIELTEHELFPDDEDLAADLAALRERGARIAIDDTGAGYAGLNQLMKLRPDIVKLDRNLTRAIHMDPARMALVESFVRFARRIGAVVCAEGIEGIEDLVALADLDVEWGQGYGVGRPDSEWRQPLPAAAAACRAGVQEALRGASSGHSELVAGDRSLEALSQHLAGVRTREELEKSLGLVAAEIHAERVSLSAFHAAEARVETLAENLQQTDDELDFTVSEYPLTEQVLRTQVAAQVLVGDPDADPTETALLLRHGLRSLLMVPVVRRGETLGLIEAYSPEERPWTRNDINRTRIIASQFAAVIEVLTLDRRG
jgi:diguanylate cyclase (GGDEF)-like protein